MSFAKIPSTLLFASSFGVAIFTETFMTFVRAGENSETFYDYYRRKAAMKHFGVDQTTEQYRQRLRNYKESLKQPNFTIPPEPKTK